MTAVAANNGVRWTTQAQQRIDNATRDFGGQVEWRYIGAEELLALLQARKPISAELQFTGQATVETFDFRRVLIGRMSVAELARLTNEYDNQLFERNIRRYLGLTGNRVNEAVAATLCAPPQRSNFYAYGSRFIAMLMGRYLLEEMDIALDGLDHRNFEQAQRLVEQRSGSYLSRAEQRIGEALGPLFSDRKRTLQRLSATFRRADLIDMLLDVGDA